VFDKETYGAILGTIYKSRVIVKNVVPYQRVVRKSEEVRMWPSHENKVRVLLNSIGKYRVLGDFHSHPYGPAALSTYDKKDMIEDAERLALLISIEEAENAITWQYDRKDKALRGTLHDEFLITIKVYTREYGSRQIRKLKIECPYMQKLNKGKFK